MGSGLHSDGVMMGSGLQNRGHAKQGSGLVFCHLLPLPCGSFHLSTAATSLTIFIAHHSRNTTKHFSQQIHRYREGGFTRLQGLPALLPEERWMLLRFSINAVTLSPALASSNDAGNQPAGAGNASLGSAYSGLRTYLAQSKNRLAAVATVARMQAKGWNSGVSGVTLDCAPPAPLQLAKTA